MAEYGFVPTNVGLAQEINQALQGEAVLFTHVAFGDGDNNLSPAQTELVNERTRVVVNDIKAVPGDPRTFKIECAIPPDTGGFNITEAGLFDEFDNLCYVAKYTGTYKPLLAEGASEDFLVVLYITVSGEANISLEIDPAVAMASRPWVETILMERDISIATAQMMAARNLLDNELQDIRDAAHDDKLTAILKWLTALEVHQSINAERASRAILN